MTKISTIINYCSNDKRFIDECINSVRDFSYNIVVSVADHFFDGQPENLDLMKQHQEDHEDVNFLLYQWTPGKSSRYWCNYSRLIAAQTLYQDCDWILFIDSDEIADTTQFKKFAIKLSSNPSINSYKLANYWYFRETYYRAKQIEDSPIIVRSQYAININLNDPGREREQFEFHNTPRQVQIDNKPIFHHYSWVRTKDEMLQKVRSWSHNIDKDWVSLVEEEFSRDFNGANFVHPSYQFDDLRQRT